MQARRYISSLLTLIVELYDISVPDIVLDITACILSSSAKFQNRLNSGIRTQECMDAALEALSGKNNIGGYTSFRMVSITNLSAMSDYVIIGGHVFH